MSLTPEGKTKKLIRDVLAKYSKHVYYYMPVPGGYGRTTIDYLGFAVGLGFAIEAKAPGEHPTARQKVIIDQIKASGAKVFVITGRDGADELDAWLATVTRTVPTVGSNYGNKAIRG